MTLLTILEYLGFDPDPFDLRAVFFFLVLSAVAAIMVSRLLSTRAKYRPALIVIGALLLSGLNILLPRDLRDHTFLPIILAIVIAFPTILLIADRPKDRQRMLVSTAVSFTICFAVILVGWQQAFAYSEKLREEGEPTWQYSVRLMTNSAEASTVILPVPQETEGGSTRLVAGIRFSDGTGIVRQVDTPYGLALEITWSWGCAFSYGSKDGHYFQNLSLENISSAQKWGHVEYWFHCNSTTPVGISVSAYLPNRVTIHLSGNLEQGWQILSGTRSRPYYQ